MVLESLISLFKAERRPWEMFFLGFLYSSVAIFLSLWIFKESASLVMVFLTVLATVPLIYQAIKVEEKKDLSSKSEGALLAEHGHVLAFFMFLFLGMTLSFTVWYVFLPEEAVRQTFYTQTQTIVDISNKVTGTVANYSFFSKIFLNNVKVLAFCILFALLYGVGAIFILTWNASVIGTAMGNFVRTHLSTYALSFGFLDIAKYFHVFSLGLLRYAIHGIPEILAYFVGGLAGGIISVAVIRHDFRTKQFDKVLLDSANLLIISLALLLVAALLEVYVTPLLF